MSGVAQVDLETGAVVLGRFRVEEEVDTETLGTLYRGTDQKSDTPVSILALSPILTDASVRARLAESLRLASGVRHPHLAGTFGLGEEGEVVVVAQEWVDGNSLDELIDGREGDPISLGASARVLSSLARALDGAHAAGPHGAVRTHAIRISTKGHVKLMEFGVTSPILSEHGADILSPAELAHLAPELKEGDAPTIAADVFSFGAVAYSLFTGRAPGADFVAPSEVHEHASDELDAWLIQCLAADPAERFPTPADALKALGPLLKGAPKSDGSEEFGVAIQVQKGGASRPSAASVPTPTPAPRAPSSADPFAAQPAPEPAAAPAPASGGVDLGATLAEIEENDGHHWLVVKDGLDHGPFSGREVVRMIVDGEISREHMVSNMDTGERRTVAEWPQFGGFASHYEAKVEQAETAKAVEAAESSEQRASRTKLFVALGIIGLVLVAGVAFVMTRNAAQEGPAERASLDGLYEMGEIEIQGTAESLPMPGQGGHAAGGRRHGGGHGGAHGTGGGAGGAGGGDQDGAGGAGLSYEDAMNRVVEMGDISQGGGAGGGQLSSSTVAGVMNRHVGRLYTRCVIPEQQRGGNFASATIDIAILGSGQVQGASARQGSAAFRACINRTVRTVRFPSFGAPRMGARYSFPTR